MFKAAIVVLGCLFIGGYMASCMQTKVEAAQAKYAAEIEAIK